MIHSMTGFAVQTRDLGQVSLHIELRSVNSRYLDLFFRIGDELRQAEPAIREKLAARLARGKVECRLNVHAGAAAPRSLSLNGTLLDQLRDAEQAVRERLPEADRLSVNEVLRWPGMLADDGVSFEQLQPAVRDRGRSHSIRMPAGPIAPRR